MATYHDQEAARRAKRAIPGRTRYSYTQFAFENQEVFRPESDNAFDIPSSLPSSVYGDKLIRFCDLNSRMEVSDCILHFYHDDYKFMQVWRSPWKYVERFRDFKAIISPNFSLYTDFPYPLQLLSCYRKQWCAAFYQSQGVEVIPCVTWGEKSSYDFCFAGIPKRSVVSVSSVGVRRDAMWNGHRGDLFRDGWKEMLRVLEPTKIILYGSMLDGLEGDIISVPTAVKHRTDLARKRRKENKP